MESMNEEASERRVCMKGTVLETSGRDGAAEAVVDCDQRLDGRGV